MKDPVEKKDEMLENPVKEEEVSANETYDINQFIRKTQLQNVILKRITENLKFSADTEIQ